MIIGDVVRAVLYLSIPVNLILGVVDKLTWLYVAQFLASTASLFWTPAKDASVPNLVPADKLEQANQLSLFTTYGTAPVAGVAVRPAGPDQPGPRLALALLRHRNQVDLALYFNAADVRRVGADHLSSLREHPASAAAGSGGSRRRRC